MAGKMMAVLLGSVATIPLMTKSSNWGITNSTGLLETSPTVVITVPKGNGGSVWMVATIDDPSDLMEYRVDGGSWVEIAGDAIAVLNSGQTLQFRATVTNVFGLVSVAVYDQIAPSLTSHALGSWVVNRLS